MTPMPAALRHALPVIGLGAPVSNAWLLPETPAGPVMVDCGHVLRWRAIRAGLGRAGLRPGDLRAVILTHRHSDHAGNAARLAARHAVPIHAHREDAMVLTGQRPRPAMPPAPGITGFMVRMENNFPARRFRPEPMEHGDEVAGLTVHWVPGHTAGSVFLHHAPSGTLFSGDTVINGQPPLAIPHRLTLAFAPYCEDHALALEGLAAFMEQGHEVRRLCPGHGPMVEGKIPEMVSRLLAS